MNFHGFNHSIFNYRDIFYETYPSRIEPEGSWPISTHSVHHFLPPATFAISPHIVAISGLTFASRYRGRPYAGRYQFYMNLNNISGKDRIHTNMLVARSNHMFYRSFTISGELWWLLCCVTASEINIVYVGSQTLPFGQSSVSIYTLVP